MAGGCSFCWLAAAGCCGWCAGSGGHCRTTQPSVGPRQKPSALRKEKHSEDLWQLWCLLVVCVSLGLCYSLVTRHGNGKRPVGTDVNGQGMHWSQSLSIHHAAAHGAVSWSIPELMSHTGTHVTTCIQYYYIRYFKSYGYDPYCLGTCGTTHVS